MIDGENEAHEAEVLTGEGKYWLINNLGDENIEVEALDALELQDSNYYDLNFHRCLTHSRWVY
jgi:hypothetical protein